MRIRWLLAGGWVVVAGATTVGFVLDGVNDPPALTFVAALAAAVVTLLIGSMACWLKGWRVAGAAGLVSLAVLPAAHFGSMLLSIEGWAPTFVVDVAAIGFVMITTAVIGGTSLHGARESSTWARHSGSRRSTEQGRSGVPVGVLVMALLLAGGCSDTDAAESATSAGQVSSTTAEPSTTVSATTTTPQILTMTTTSPVAVGPPLGRLAGTIDGWPDGAASCSAVLQAWGPYPYRRTEVLCDPGHLRPVPFAFEQLPAGDWAIAAWLSWTDDEGGQHRRMNEFPPPTEPEEWFTVTADATTPVDLVADRPGGVISGTVRDPAAQGLRIGGQYEPGAPLIHIVAYDSEGRFVSGGGNGCDGSYEVWLPAGRYALAAWVDELDPPVWLSEWIPSGKAFVVPPGMDPFFAIDPSAIPTDSWVQVEDGANITGLTVQLESDAAQVGGENGWFPWYAEPIPGEPLPDDDPRRDPETWIGSVVWLDDDRCCPPALIVDGEHSGLGGWSTEAVRFEPGMLMVVTPLDATTPYTPSGETGTTPGYRIVLVVDVDGIVTDALYVETGPEQSVSAEGHTPHDPGVAFVVLGTREAACGIFAGPAERAWRSVDGALVEVDPIGVVVAPAGG